jgi:uncharacterized protein
MRPSRRRLEEPTMATDSAPVDRYGLEVIGYDECLELLGSQPIGRIAVVHDGVPTILPVTHTMIGASVMFRTRDGSKLEAAIMGRPAAFEVDSYDADLRSGWSVVVRGVVDMIDDPDRLAQLDEVDLVPWSDAAVDGRWVALQPQEVTGRRIPSDD